MPFPVGIKGRAETVVTAENTAIAVGSGTVPVFATPCMAALMEQSAVSALAPYLSEGACSVGTRLEVCHDAPTPIGLRVWAECELIESHGKVSLFSVYAYDETGLIGKGLHERCLVGEERFLSKAAEKSRCILPAEEVLL